MKRRDCWLINAGLAAVCGAGRLVPLLERWSAPFPGYYLCYPAQRQMAPPLRAFIDSVRSAARESAG